MLDNDADEQVGGSEGAMFLRRSGLSNEQLREVWRLASGGTSKQRLSREDWLIACKLVAAVQHKGVEPAVASIVGAEAAGLPLAISTTAPPRTWAWTGCRRCRPPPCASWSPIPPPSGPA